ncbi:hypothetical protein, partial [Candidatus Phytoplasma pyri]|uniref:hypothetical protein n=1 Tax=Candidatus Phytoplasma pyri TaxID=47566 RepID=UPI00398361F6
IKTAYVFYKIEKPKTEKPKIHHLKTTIPFNQSKIDYIKNYLNINQTIQLNCYNSNSNLINTPLLANSCYNNDSIDVIYFDDINGSKLLTTANITDTDLYNISNNSKNVYIFSLTHKKPQMNVINHYVGSYQEIKSFMKAKYNVVVEGDSIPGFNSYKNVYLDCYFKNPESNLLGAYFESYPNKKYEEVYYEYTLQDMLQKNDIIKTAYIFWYDENLAKQNEYNQKMKQYEIDLQNWKDNCLFKPNIYKGVEIKEKLGKNNQELYCLDNGFITNCEIDSNLCNFTTKIQPYNFNNKYLLYYKYVYHYKYESCYFSKYNFENPSYYVNLNENNPNLLFLFGAVNNGDIKFETYVDTTPPPTKPTL